MNSWQTNVILSSTSFYWAVSRYLCSTCDFKFILFPFSTDFFFLCPESHVQKIQRKAVPKTDRPQAENARRIKGKTATDCFAKMCAFNSFLCNPLGSCIQ